MIRRLVFTLVSILVTWAGGVRLAEASCESTSIQVLVTPIVWLSDVIPVTWYIDPACAVIETGLLLGRDPAALTPAGQPIYGQRASYEQALPVSEGGGYLVAAYARDEAGSVVQSTPQLVIIHVPPLLPPDTHGSHGPLPFYTGTDDDFLQPAGEPHYASLRRIILNNQQFTTVTAFTGFPPTSFIKSSGFHDRVIASTHRTDVLSGQAPPLTVNGVPFTIDPATVNATLDALDSTFGFLGYPRSGLYIAACTVRAGFLPKPRFETPFCIPFTDFLGFSLAYADISSAVDGNRGNASMRSSETYFIPKPPPGKRVQSTKLRTFVFSLLTTPTDDFSVVRLSGKAPTTFERTGCVSGFFVTSCSAWVTWDFTDEARALAAQGGGELLVTLDPVPPALLPSQIAAGYNIVPVVNYPWKHGHENGALTLTFEEDCPKELKLRVAPSVVRPLINTKLKGDARTMPTEATVDAMVKACPAPGESPAPVEVTFEIRPPAAGSAEVGGHLHTAPPRPTGALQDIDRGQATDRCTVTTFTDGTGSCAVTYRAGEVSGVETIVARAEGFAEAQATVTVKVPGLQNFATFGGGPWRLTGDRPGLHTDNHWGTSNAISKTMVMAARVRKDYSASMGVNDMSLLWGGMFDINGDWNTRFHITHRQGTGADIDRCALSLIPNNPNPQSNKEKECPAEWVVLPKKDYFERVCMEQGGTLAKEATIHCEFPQ